MLDMWWSDHWDPYGYPELEPITVCDSTIDLIACLTTTPFKLLAAVKLFLDHDQVEFKWPSIRLAATFQVYSTDTNSQGSSILPFSGWPPSTLWIGDKYFYLDYQFNQTVRLYYIMHEFIKFPWFQRAQKQQVLCVKFLNIKGKRGNKQKIDAEHCVCKHI